MDHVKTAIKLTKEVCIEIIAYFMLGLPGETIELSMKTIELVKELDPDFVKLNLTVPYPETELYRLAIKEGLLKSVDWSKYTFFSAYMEYDPIYVPKGMIKKELFKM